MIVTTTVAYSYYFSKNYPLPLSNRISFDAKLQFIREHIDLDKIDTIVVGSSLALNNVQGIVLEETSKNCKAVLNLSMWSIGPVQVEQILELSDAFPNLERIIYSGQFSDFGSIAKLKDYDSVFLKKYISNELDPMEYSSLLLNSCKDLSFCINRQKEWKSKYGMKNKFAYLNFDYTGSAPLYMYGKDIVMSRWENPHGIGQHQGAFDALSRMVTKANKNGIKFYFVQQPYRQPLIDKYPHVQKTMEFFSKRVEKITLEKGGKFLNLYKALHLSDKYFADRSHLNDQGSALGSKVIGKFIDENEK